MFKRCPMCRHAWETRRDFLADPDLEIIGYQVSFDNVRDGLLLFNHSCETTLAIEVRKFDDFYKGPLYDMGLNGTEECPDLCSYMDNLDECREKCKYAYAREIIQIIRKWPKNEPKSSAVS